MGKTPARRVSASTSPVITLLTDFGLKDYFVAAVKGVILGMNPRARIVDITHEIPEHDIEAAAFTVLAVAGSFPAGTIHLAVVDPGVGSSRKPLLIVSGGQFFVGPDNGLFSYVMQEDALAYELTNSDYFRQPLSQTFHGRDVFAPVAAALSSGIKPESLGERIAACVTLPSLKPKKLSDGLEARIIHIDRFGNCITNLTPRDIRAEEIGAGTKLRVGDKRIESFRRFYGDHARGGKGTFAIWGSAGFLEISAENRSAAKVLGVKCGDKVWIDFTDA